MPDELGEKGLLTDNPWTDAFQIVFYHCRHHEGRRARQRALAGAPDCAHWHDFFELRRDLCKLDERYEKRLETGQIE